MGTHRTWDETMSPQWKYLHQKESMLRRGGRKTAARLRKTKEKEMFSEESEAYTIRDPAFKSTKKIRKKDEDVVKQRDTKINKLLKEEMK